MPGLTEITVDMQKSRPKGITNLSPNQIVKAKNKRSVKREIRKNGLPPDKMANIVAGYLYSKQDMNSDDYQHNERLLTSQFDYGNEEDQF